MLNFDLTGALQSDIYRTDHDAHNNVKNLAFKCLLHDGQYYRHETVEEYRAILFQHIKKYKNNMSPYVNSIDIISELINKYYQPTLAGNFAGYYADIPKESLWRIFVDVNKQRDPRERGYVWLREARTWLH